MEAEKKQAEDKLEKFNSMNLMSKDHVKEEVDITAELKALNEAVSENSERRS